MKKVLFLLLALLAILYAEDATKSEKTASAKASATLSITTEPAGVSVIIDDNQTLKTPFTTELNPGSHVLILKKKGYYGKKLKVNLKEGKAISKNITLRAPGKLQLTSEPLGATVVLAGDTVGQTPFTSKELKPGSYMVALSKEGYEPLEQELTFESGELKELSLSLTKIVVDTLEESVEPVDTLEESVEPVDTLEESVEPVDTLEESVEPVDTLEEEKSQMLTSGLSLQTTPDSVFVIVDAKDTLISPFTIDLVAGEHELVLKKKGYYAKKVRITIPEDTVLSQMVTLRAPSYLSISANVDSCRVLLNKESVGATPYTSKALKAGTYEIIVLKSGYKTHRSTVNVSEGVHKRVAITLESKGEKAPVKAVEEKPEEKKERKKVAIIAGAVFGAFLTMITAFELSGVGE